VLPPIIFVLFIATLPICSPAQAGSLFGFVDDSGVAHFSDFASTPRHQRLLTEGARASPVRRGGPNPSTPRPSAQLQGQVVRIASEHGLDPALVLAIVATESAFNPHARSPKGALGLMQLMPDTARRLGVADPLDPEANLRGGVRYLSMLLDMFDDLSLALAAYNAGEAAVIRHGRSIPPYPETLAYVPKVMRHYADFQQRSPTSLGTDQP